MKIAVQGCAHGELEKIYDTIEYIQQREGFTVDLLLCCGDFQAVRNEKDLSNLAVKDTYRRMNSFYKYYSGEKQAPVLTVFIGGNHEASNHLQEMEYGGWVAPNIYYLGYSGVVQFANLRIGGISGIFKFYNYKKGHFEHSPYDESQLRSVYHIREFEIFKLLQISRPIDIMMSHDWPQGIIEYGPKQELFRKKSFLAKDRDLGSPPAAKVLRVLQPDYWFSAHLHVKYPAIVTHNTGKKTKFLALSKVLPKSDFLQILDFPDSDLPKKLSYDPEWLAILIMTKHLESKSADPIPIPTDKGSERYDFRPSEGQIQNIIQHASDLSIPQSAFVRNVAPYGYSATFEEFENPQTAQFLHFLEELKPIIEEESKEENPEEIALDEDLLV